MPISTQVTFRNMDSSPAVRTRIQRQADKLALFHPGIMSCRVVVRAPHHHHHKGRLYQVSVDLKVPGHEIAVTRAPSQDHAHEDVNVAIRDAFAAVTRRLEDMARETRGDIKTHLPEPHGRIARTFPQEGYGFIQSAAGDEVYFHRNSVANGGFEQLHVGCEVRFNTELGEKGLQATVVKPIGKHHLTP